MMPYPPKQAAILAQISVASVKNYVKNHDAYFSASARPGPGIARSYTDRDIQVLRTIARMSREGLAKEKISERLADGELDGWQPTDSVSEPISGPQQAAAPQAALALANQWHALQNAYEAERAERQALAERLIAAESRAAKLEAELSAAKMPWWKRLFG